MFRFNSKQEYPTSKRLGNPSSASAGLKNLAGKGYEL
jgi:hypothetical protein